MSDFVSIALNVLVLLLCLGRQFSFNKRNSNRISDQSVLSHFRNALSCFYMTMSIKKLLTGLYRALASTQLLSTP